MSLLKAKIPVIVVIGILCLGLGVAAGITYATLEGYQLTHPMFQMPERGKEVKAAFEKELAAAKGVKTTKGSTESIKGLVALVGKLDQLMQKPLKLELDKKEEQEVFNGLQGLADLKELTEEEAKKRLEALLKTLAAHKETLETAGFRWPGKEPRPSTIPNPFQDEANRKHLEDLNRKVKQSE